jgi:hypothetical protein
MSRLVCLRHPKYLGTDAPILSCKACCAIFVDAIRRAREQAGISDTYQWLEQKRQENLNALARPHSADAEPLQSKH